MPPSLETEPTPSFLARLGTKWKVAAGVAAAMSLTAVAFAAGGGDESENIATKSTETSTTIEGFDPTTSSIEDSTTLAPTPDTSKAVSTTVTKRPVTTLPTSRPPANQRQTTQKPTTTSTSPPVTDPPPTTPSTTPAPPPTTQPSRAPLRAPTNLAIGGRAPQCRDVPPPPGGASGNYGYMCLVGLSATQNDASSEENYRVSTIFKNCAVDEQPFRINEQDQWHCENSWAQAEGAPRNHLGRVSSAGSMYPNQESCWLAFASLEHFTGAFWEPVQTSDEVPQKICATIDNDGNVIN